MEKIVKERAIDYSKRKRCGRCAEEINAHAVQCPHCHKWQKRRLSVWFDGVFPACRYFAVVIGPVVLMVIAIWQLNEARNERIAAVKAVKEAQVASASAIKAKNLSFASL